MDDSQSSDLFSETSNMQEISAINAETYSILITKIKAFAHLKVDGNKIIQSGEFITTLEDCRVCLYQSLDTIISLLDDSSLQIIELRGYLEDTICILQILSNLIKNVVETIAITCCTINNFPTSTGHIILSVFKHCKDSESIYGDSLKLVEKQLKDLFKSCHELQLTYLMALEKHMVFDLTEKDEQDILLATLDINLNIGEVVQSLDVKTMAEQWKAYTMICEKYSNFLMDQNVYNNSTMLLASTIKNNIITALEADEEDKIVLRSLKVASFSLKILLRICNVFKCSLNNNYEHIVELFLRICLCVGPNYEVVANKSSHFSKLVDTILSIPIDSLISHLVTEEKFLKEVFSRKINDLKDYELLGYILLNISIIKVLVKKHIIRDYEYQIIGCVFTFLPYCHKWFNIGLKYRYTSKEVEIQYGLYEHLLIHIIALTNSMGLAQYQKLERYLYEAILGTDYYCALFASNLWVLLCRFGKTELHLNTLLGLLKVYKKLECHESFPMSPQQIYMSFTIEKLFETLNNSEKHHLYKQLNIRSITNIGIWSALKIRNLPDNVQTIATEWVVEKLNNDFNRAVNEIEPYYIDHLINYMKLASTCSFLEKDPRLEELLVRGWLKACPICKKVMQRNLSMEHVSYFRYVESLTRLTNCYVDHLEITSLVKIVQVISNILLIGNMETVILLFELFCKICTFVLNEQTDDTIECIISYTLNSLEMDDELQEYISSCITTNDSIRNLTNNLGNFQNKYPVFKNKFDDHIKWQEGLEMTALNEYTHKCMERKQELNTQEIKRTKSDSNFDLGDIESLFDDSDGRTAKRAKFDVDIDNLVRRLEADAAQVCQIKENVLSDEYKDRIRSVCEKLKNIVS